MVQNEFELDDVLDFVSFDGYQHIDEFVKCLEKAGLKTFYLAKGSRYNEFTKEHETTNILVPYGSHQLPINATINREMLLLYDSDDYVDKISIQKNEFITGLPNIYIYEGKMILDWREKSLVKEYNIQEVVFELRKITNYPSKTI